MVVICAMPNLDPYLKPLPEFCSARESSFVYSATEVSFNVPMSHSDVGYITMYIPIDRKEKKIEDEVFRNGCKCLIWRC